MARTFSDNVKVAGISGVVAIAVALIGVVPVMRSNLGREYDAMVKARDQRIKELEAQVGQLTERVTVLSPPYALRGSLRSTADNKPIADADLYVANPDNQALVDDNGNFVVKNTFKQPYWVLLARQSGQVLRLLIDPEEPVGEAAGVAIRYTFDKE